MNNKKGVGNEIDWIIGIGLFLLSIMAIFVLFKPGVNPVYDYSTLIDIVNENMNNNLEWEITKTPIFIEPIPYPDPNTDKSTIIPAGSRINMILDTMLLNILTPELPYQYIQMDETNRDKFLRETEPLDDTTSPKYAIKDLKEYNMELLYVPGITTDEEGKQFVEEMDRDSKADTETDCENIGDIENPTPEETVHIDLLKEYCSVRNCNSDNCIPATIMADNRYSNKFEKVEDGQIAIKGVIIKGRTGERDSKYVLLYSKDPINMNGNIRSKNRNELRTIYNYNACVVNPDKKTPQAEKSTDQCNAKYTIGIKEKLRGLSTYKFSKLNKDSCNNGLKGYECIKEKWGFPQSKEFKIDIYTIDQHNSISFPDDKLLPVNANVFARQFNTFVLTDDGLRVPVLVSIKVW